MVNNIIWNEGHELKPNISHFFSCETACAYSSNCSLFLVFHHDFLTHSLNPNISHIIICYYNKCNWLFQAIQIRQKRWRRIYLRNLGMNSGCVVSECVCSGLVVKLTRGLFLDSLWLTSCFPTLSQQSSCICQLQPRREFMCMHAHTYYRLAAHGIWVMSKQCHI